MLINVQNIVHGEILALNTTQPLYIHLSSFHSYISSSSAQLSLRVEVILQYNHSYSQYHPFISLVSYTSTRKGNNRATCKINSTASINMYKNMNVRVNRHNICDLAVLGLQM